MPWVFERLESADVATIAGVACAIAIALFLLRPRPPRVVVSSHFLWEQILPKRHNPLLKELLMLALQILALGALAAALGDPRAPAEDAEEEVDLAPTERLWVIDLSMSMEAREADGRSRLEVVRARLLDELEALPPQVGVAIVGAGRTPALLAPFGDDRSRARLALRMLDVDGVDIDLRAALRLVAAAPGPSPAAVIEVFTDHPDANAIVDAFTETDARRVLVRAPFTPGPNLAITGFDLRGSEGLPPEEEALVRLLNASPWPATATLALETADAILGEVEVTLPPYDEIVRRYRFLPLPGGGIEAVLRDAKFEGVPDGILDGDILATDDRAFGWIEPVREARVLLVTDGNRFLDRVLALLPGVHLTRIAPSAYRSAMGAEVDLVFFDGWGPGADRAPPRAFFIDPRPGQTPFTIQARFPSPALTDFNYEHPVFAGVVLRDLQVEVGSILVPEPGDVRLLGSPSGAMALVRRGPNGERWIGWGFDFADSDLPLRLAFPQTIVNALLWAREGRATEPAEGGRGRLSEPVWLGAATADVEAPIVITDLLRAGRADARGDGREAARASVTTASGDGPQPYRFGRPGLYRIDEPTGTRKLAINVFDPVEADTTRLPDDDPSVVPVPEARTEPPQTTPWWVWLCVGAMALVAVEFGMYTR
jgi:hypothetical protein